MKKTANGYVRSVWGRGNTDLPRFNSARTIQLEKACCNCKGKNLMFYLWDRSWCVDCTKRRSRERARKDYRLNREKCKARTMVGYWKNRDRRIAQHKARWERIKMAVFDHYGGRRCACCGEDRREFLSVDHIDGGGTKHRRQLKEGGRFTFRWIYNNNFPAGFQILCMNCNWGKGQNFRKYGVHQCPHEQPAVF